MIAVIVPAHNEESHLGACLDSVLRATLCGGLNGETVLVVVVLDNCTDGTENVALLSGVPTLAVCALNVGAAREAGAALALAAGARRLAFTDADTVVAPDWLSVQLSLGSDAVCGTVAVHDWGSCGKRMRSHFEATYTDADGHQHIHGANLGVSAQAYRDAGGFQPLVSSEDAALGERIGTSAGDPWTL